VTKASGLAAIGYPSGGCSSSGVQSAWLAIPALLFFAATRRRKRALAVEK
jgi:MYXO-CTERM domain-containing protein